MFCGLSPASFSQKHHLPMVPWRQQWEALEEILGYFLVVLPYSSLLCHSTAYSSSSPSCLTPIQPLLHHQKYKKKGNLNMMKSIFSPYWFPRHLMSRCKFCISAKPWTWFFFCFIEGERCPFRKQQSHISLIHRWVSGGTSAPGATPAGTCWDPLTGTWHWSSHSRHCKNRQGSPQQ